MVSPAVALCVFKVFLCQGSYCLCAMGGNISVELKPPQARVAGNATLMRSGEAPGAVMSAMIVARAVEVAVAVEIAGDVMRGNGLLVGRRSQGRWQGLVVGRRSRRWRWPW